MREGLIDLQEIANRCKRTVEEVERIIERARESLLPVTKRTTVIEKGVEKRYEVTRLGAGILDTDHGKFWEYDFQLDDQWGEYLAIWHGEVDEFLMPKVAGMKHLLMRTDRNFGDGSATGTILAIR